MTTLLIPGPDGAEPQKNGNPEAQGDEDGAAADDRQRHPNRAKHDSIPSETDCLRAIAHVAGLVAMGLLEPAQGNSIRASYREILAHYKSKAKEAEKSLSNADVMDLLRKDPKLLNLLAPLLTGEQLDMVMNVDDEDKDGQT
jgi:hypothetical protein